MPIVSPENPLLLFITNEKMLEHVCQRIDQLNAWQMFEKLGVFLLTRWDMVTFLGAVLLKRSVTFPLDKCEL